MATAASAPGSTPAPAAPTAPRVIPGLSSSAQRAAPSAAKRSRKKKAPTGLPGAAGAAAGESPGITDDVALAAALRDTVPTPGGALADEVAGGLGLGVELPAAVASGGGAVPPVASAADIAKPVSPVQQVVKRIKALKKKIQRVEGYETSATALNEDQKRAVASKPGLLLTIKELTELLSILEEDEKADELRIKAIRAEEEHKVQARVNVAVRAAQKASTSDMTLLLQFLHLYSLFAGPSGGAGFAPPVLPPVVERATGQEAAAVMSLFHELADGPISGGGGDAMERIVSLKDGHESEVIPGVTYARLKQMIIALTAPPEEVDSHLAAAPSAPALSGPPGINGDAASHAAPSTVDAVPGSALGTDAISELGAGQPPQAAAPNAHQPVFLQPSELDGPAPPPGIEAVHPAPVRRPIDATPSSLHPPSQPAASAAPEPTPIADGWTMVPDTKDDPSQGLQATTEARTLDWAQDVESNAALPPLDSSFGVTAPAPSAANGRPAVDSDGFQEARPRTNSNSFRGAGSRGSGERRGRGDGRGRGRGRGEGHRGGAASMSDNWRTPRPEGAPGPAGQRGDREGGFRGSPRGRGRGEYRGRGAPRTDTPPAAAA